MDERAWLTSFTDIVGSVFGTEDFSFFLYSLLRMQKPERVVELGTGLGVSALWMALAIKQNGKGHIWTVDDFEWVEKQKLTLLITELRNRDVLVLEDLSPAKYYDGISQALGVNDHLTFVKTKIILQERGHFARYPFSKEPIDLLFSDFQHGPTKILAILAHFLPKMSPASSIIIHSAPTSWPSYLLLEQLVEQFNRGRIPLALQELCEVDLGKLAHSRRMVLVHLTESKNRNQNSAAWLKIEPIDLLPHPRSTMRGYE
jgi:hypothetical protein